MAKEAHPPDDPALRGDDLRTFLSPITSRVSDTAHRLLHPSPLFVSPGRLYQSGDLPHANRPQRQQKLSIIIDARTHTRTHADTRIYTNTQTQTHTHTRMHAHSRTHAARIHTTTHRHTLTRTHKHTRNCMDTQTHTSTMADPDEQTTLHVH